MTDLHDAIDDALENVQFLRSPRDRLSVLNTLYDRIERNTIAVTFLEGRMANLIDLIPYETDLEVRRRMFDVVEKAMMTNLSIAPSIDVLLPFLSEEDPGLVSGFLLLIPLTGQAKYVPIARKYLEHENPIIRSNAQYALKYMSSGG